MTKHNVKASNLRVNDIVETDGATFEIASIATFSDYITISMRRTDDPTCLFIPTDHFPLNYLFVVCIPED